MKFGPVSPRERRTIRLAVFVLLPSLLYVYGLRPYVASLGAMKDLLVIERDALSRERALVASFAKTPQLRRDTDLAVQSAQPRLFVGRDDVMASSELASYLTDMALRTRVNLQQAGTRPSAVSATGVRTLRVEIRGESDLEGILAFLNALETGDKLVRFDKLDISRTPGGRGEEGGFETLSVAATVAGFAIAEIPAGDTSRTRTGRGGQRGSP